jgi:putative transcriptional regulator
MKNRDLGQEIVESIRAIKRGEGKTYYRDLPMNPKEVRERLNLGISAFAALCGVSLQTVRSWEQGTRQPSGAIKALLAIAAKYPDVLLEVLQTSPTLAH